MDRASKECCESEGGIQGRVSICTGLFCGKLGVGVMTPTPLACESTWPPAPRPSKSEPHDRREKKERKIPFRAAKVNSRTVQSGNKPERSYPLLTIEESWTPEAPVRRVWIAIGKCIHEKDEPEEKCLDQRAIIDSPPTCHLLMGGDSRSGLLHHSTVLRANRRLLVRHTSRRQERA